MIERYFTFTSDKEIGLGHVTRIYKRNSKHRIRLNTLIKVSRKDENNVTLAKNKVFFSLSYNEPENVEEANSIIRLLDKIYAKGVVKELS